MVINMSDFMENKQRVQEEKTEWEELEGRLKAQGEEYRNIPVPAQMRKRIGQAALRGKRLRRIKLAGTVAAAAAVLLFLPNTGAGMAYAMGSIPVVGRLFQAVTFRDYQYESERFSASVEVPRIQVEDPARPQEETTGAAQESGEETKGADDPSGKLEETIEQVNIDIEQVTNQMIEEFQACADSGESYGGLEIRHETVTDNERYFTLKLSVFRSSGSGMESYKFYTIDKHSGRRIQIGDLFQEGSGYAQLLGDEIRRQMKEIMERDESKVYWVDSVDMPELNWQGIKEDQNFYFDAGGNLVIVFDEYEVAPGYMGAQEFTVDRALFEGILKQQGERKPADSVG